MATSVLGLRLGKLGKLELGKKFSAQAAQLKAERENATLCSVLTKRNERAGAYFTEQDIFQSKGIIDTIYKRVPEKDWPKLKPQHDAIPDDDHFERAVETVNDGLTGRFIEEQQAGIAGQIQRELERIEEKKAAYHRDLRANDARKRVVKEMAQDYVSAMNKIKHSDWSEAVKLAEQERTTKEYSARANAYLKERPVRPLDPSILNPSNHSNLISLRNLTDGNAAKITWKMESRDWDREGGRAVAPFRVDENGVCHFPADK